MREKIYDDCRDVGWLGSQITFRLSQEKLPSIASKCYRRGYMNLRFVELWSSLTIFAWMSLWARLLTPASFHMLLEVVFFTTRHKSSVNYSARYIHHSQILLYSHNSDKT
jgi:hypothetical protein